MYLSDVHLPQHSFKDKVIMITGAASGIGRAACHLFADLGANLVLLDLNEDLGSQACHEIKEKGGQALFVKTDVTQDQEISQAVKQTLETLNRIDSLINCAGSIRRATVPELTEMEWDRILNTNLKSVFLMSKSIIPIMQKQGGGSLVNVASGWGLTGGPKAAAYCAAKGGVVQLTKAMAIDHGRDNIRINCVCPGDTNTPLLIEEAHQLNLTKDSFFQQSAKRPLGRIGTPQEIASAIAFLASEDARFITGTSLLVDGGGLAGTA